MNMIRIQVAILAAMAIVQTLWSATVTFPLKTGDIASDNADGWNGTKPGSSDVARFDKSVGAYTLSSDATFGSVSMMASGVFNLDTSGNHKIRASNFFLGYHNVGVTLNGGMLDLSLATSAADNVPARQLAACNQNGVHWTTLALAKECVVTNASTVRLAYNGYSNKIRITDSSRVYSDSVLLCNNYSSSNCTLEVSSGGVLTCANGNFRDTAGTSAAYLVPADTENSVVVTGEGSKIELLSKSHFFRIGDTYGRNSLSVSDGGELIVPYIFILGNSANGNGNSARFDTGAKFSFGTMKIGENGSRGNMMEICGNATTGTCSSVYIGGSDTASACNTLVLRNASLSCNRVIVSSPAGSVSNAFYIVGSDTSFTAKVTTVARYPFFNKGAWNTFEMDGAEWNYWLNMQIDEAASSNTIRFVNGARMNMGGGLFSGTNHIASCGNRVYVGSGSRVSLSFVYLSREDNVLTVSNATVVASGSDGSYNGNIKIGNRLQNVDPLGISGNGLVMQGEAPYISADRAMSFENGSFLRFEVAEGRYAPGHVPLSAASISWDASSSLDVCIAAPHENPGQYVLASASGGITIPDAVLTAANASLSAQSNGRAKVVLKNGNKDLVLKVAKGLVISFR